MEEAVGREEALMGNEWNRSPKGRSYNREYMRRYRLEHPEKSYLATKKARGKKPDKYAEYHRAWRAANLDKFREYGRKWRRDNPEKYCEVAKNWRSTPNGKAYVIRRTCLRRGAGTVSVEDIKTCFAVFGSSCAYCGTGRGLQLDHVWPVTKGGRSGVRNIVPACKRCNLSKGTSEWRGWFRGRAFYSRARELVLERHVGVLCS